VFRLLDGDRIATLAASFIGDLARNAGIASKLKIGTNIEPQRGVVKVLHTGVGADNGKLEDLLDVICASVFWMGIVLPPLRRLSLAILPAMLELLRS
jgi:hypothetical protein